MAGSAPGTCVSGVDAAGAGGRCGPHRSPSRLQEEERVPIPISPGAPVLFAHGGVGSLSFHLSGELLMAAPQPSRGLDPSSPPASPLQPHGGPSCVLWSHLRKAGWRDVVVKPPQGKGRRIAWPSWRVVLKDFGSQITRCHARSRSPTVPTSAPWLERSRGCCLTPGPGWSTGSSCQSSRGASRARALGCLAVDALPGS